MAGNINYRRLNKSNKLCALAITMVILAMMILAENRFDAKQKQQDV